MDRGHRRVLAKFRSCNLPLAIETGRYNRPKTPVIERCHMDAIEDETHFLIDCEFYSDIKGLSNTHELKPRHAMSWYEL